MKLRTAETELDHREHREHGVPGISESDSSVSSVVRNSGLRIALLLLGLALTLSAQPGARYLIITHDNFYDAIKAQR